MRQEKGQVKKKKDGSWMWTITEWYPLKLNMQVKEAKKSHLCFWTPVVLINEVNILPRFNSHNNFMN